MRILCIGDVVGSVGCEFLRNNLPAFKRFNSIDLVICNGENSADGNGITPVSAQHLFDSGVDAITLGNHSFRRKEVYDLLDSSEFIARPYNFSSKSVPGHGVINLDMGRRVVSIVNLMGNIYVENGLQNAFEAADEALKLAEGKIIIVDFHAEATSEKTRDGLLPRRQSIGAFRHSYPRTDIRRDGSSERHGLHHRRRNDRYNPLGFGRKNRHNHQPPQNRTSCAF